MFFVTLPKPNSLLPKWCFPNPESPFPGGPHFQVLLLLVSGGGFVGIKTLRKKATTWRIVGPGVSLSWSAGDVFFVLLLFVGFGDDAWWLKLNANWCNFRCYFGSWRFELRHLIVEVCHRAFPISIRAKTSISIWIWIFSSSSLCSRDVGYHSCYENTICCHLMKRYFNTSRLQSDLTTSNLWKQAWGNDGIGDFPAKKLVLHQKTHHAWRQKLAISLFFWFGRVLTNDLLMIHHCTA